MNCSILITTSPFSKFDAENAYQTCEKLLKENHSIALIFFYGDGVLHANDFILSENNEKTLTQKWIALSKKFSVDLMVCVNSCFRRGILSEEEAKLRGKTGHNLAPHFKVGGLASLIEAIIKTDQFLNL